MIRNAAETVKQIDLLAVGPATLEDHQVVDGPIQNGRANCVRWEPRRLGGMAPLSCQAVRIFDPHAALTCFALVGEIDQQEVLAAADNLGLSRDGMLPVAGKRTNRNLVIQDPGGNRFIVRVQRNISPESDITLADMRRLRRTIPLCKAFLTRHRHIRHCGALLRTARAAGCYAALVPAEPHFPYLAQLPAHLVVCNDDEARVAVGDDFGSLEHLFEEFSSQVMAEHVIMTTGPGPIFVADRISGERYIVEPIALPSSPDGCLRSVGCGDSLAGTICFLMGQPQRITGGRLLREAIRFAQRVVAVHMTDNELAARDVREEYGRLRSQFEPDAVSSTLPALATHSPRD